MSETPIALLPCPFCGGPPVPWVALPMSAGGGALSDEHIDKDLGTFVEAYVWCHECGARSGDVDENDAFEAKRYDVSTLVYSMDDAERLKRFAAEQWNDRSLRNLALYAAGYDTGMHIYPRTEEA